MVISLSLSIKSIYFLSNLNYLTPKAPYLLYQALKLAKNVYTPIKTSIFGLNWSFYGLWPMRFLVLLVKFEQLYPINPNMPPEVSKLAILDITNGPKIAIH